MEALTLTITAVGAILVFALPPVQGLVVFFAALVWYPSTLTVKLGTFDFSVCRILVLALFLQVAMNYSDWLNRFKFRRLDTLVLVYFGAEIVSGLTTSADIMSFLEWKAGGLFDLVLPYFAVRVILRDKGQYVFLLKSVMIMSAPMVCLGLYQSLTGINVAAPLLKHAAWGSADNYLVMARFGFYRANVTLGICIHYGLFFATMGAVCIGLKSLVRHHRVLYYAGMVMMVLGVLTSMSSGPFLALLLSAAFVLSYKYRYMWRQALVVFILMAMFVEVLSNRHFYNVLAGLTMNAQTAWYRARLIDVVLFEGGMSGHWITGYGSGVDPGWCAVIDQRNHTDLCNHFIMILSYFGLVGLVPFLAVLWGAFKHLAESFKSCYCNPDRKLVWALSSALFGVVGVMNSVGLFGKINTIFFIVLGFCGCMPVLVKGPAKQVVVLRGSHQSATRARREHIRNLARRIERVFLRSSPTPPEVADGSLSGLHRVF